MTQSGPHGRRRGRVTTGAVEGPRSGSGADQARLRGEWRRGSKFERDLRLDPRAPAPRASQVDAIRNLIDHASDASDDVRSHRARSDNWPSVAVAAAQQWENLT